MKFLIIGASGFIGRHIYRYIKSLGYKVIGTQYESKYLELITFNILEHRIKECIDTTPFKNNGPIFCIICSAIAQIDRCLIEKKISYQVNVKNTIQLINDMTSLGVVPIFISTDNVYNGFRGYYSEDDEICPVNEYGRQKAEVEKYLISNISESIILRLSKIVGDNPQESHLFSEWYQLIMGKKPIMCIEGQIFSPTFVGDIAKAVVRVCERRLSGLYNIANKEFFSRAELACQFLFALGENNISIISKYQNKFNFADLRPEKTYLDSTKFIKTTGMQFTSMREVFKSFIKNSQSNRKENR